MNDFDNGINGLQVISNEWITAEWERKNVNKTSIACPGVLMGVVQFPFQPQGERNVTLQQSLLFHHQHCTSKQAPPWGENTQDWTNERVRGSRNVLLLNLYKNIILAAGNKTSVRSSDKIVTCHCPEQRKMSWSTLFGSVKVSSWERSKKSQRGRACGNLSVRSEVVLHCLGEWQRHAEASGLCKHIEQIRASTSYTSVLLSP